MFGFGNQQPDRIIKRSRSSCQSNEAQGREPELTQAEPCLNKEAAQQRYDHAFSIYQQTRDPEHWRYLQRCIDELE